MQKRKNIFSIATILLAASAIYQSGSFIIWLIAYVKESNFPIHEEIGPLLSNNLFIIAPILMFLVLRLKKKINTGLFYTSLVATVTIIGLQVLSLFATDPLQAGLPMIMIATPMTIALSVLAFINLLTPQK